MKSVHVISGRGVPLRRSDVDTDQIIPAEWLKRVERTGFEKGLFSTWRDDRNFVLNDERYAGASILVAGPSFGVGSSREHAVWAIQQYGFDAVIAPSFSDIFSGNAFKNGILTVVLSQEQVDRLMEVAETDPITIDLEHQTVTTPFQDRFTFEIDPFRKHCLLGGLDEVAITMESSTAITGYEARMARDKPWLARGTGVAA